MFALLAIFFSTPIARAADVEPLRSADLESRLKSAGFDDAQRAKILADYAAYVQRYSTSVATLIIEWQGLASVQPSSIEEARTRQSKGRAAAQAIDDAERPLLDAIRGAARTDQTAAVNQLLMLLEIRRDLAFSSTLRDGMFARKAVDIFEIVDGADFSAEKRVVLKPFLDQYLVERQAIVRGCVTQHSMCHCAASMRNKSIRFRPNRRPIQTQQIQSNFKQIFKHGFKRKKRSAKRS